MNFELYEVWAVDEVGHEELIETTSSKRQATEIAEANLGLGYMQTIVYQAIWAWLTNRHFGAIIYVLFNTGVTKWQPN